MITIKNLEFSFKQERLFKDLNLDIQPGSICGILGKNGAGKSTLLNLVSGLLNRYRGSIRVNDYIPYKRISSMLENLYMIPEKISLPAIKGNDYRKLCSPFYPNFCNSKFAKLMQEYEVNPEKKLTQMSQGQKKKFIIAFALSTNCSLLLMDEPTNGLDIPSKKQFRKSLINTFNKDQLILISTHQVRDLEDILDKIVILDTGKIIFNYSSEEIENKLMQFNTVEEVTDQTIVYSEKSIGGYTYLSSKSNTSHLQCPVDVELLFNAAVSNSHELNSIFNN